MNMISLIQVTQQYHGTYLSDLFPHVLPPTHGFAYLSNLGGLGRLAWYCDDGDDGYHAYHSRSHNQKKKLWHRMHQTDTPGT